MNSTHDKPKSTGPSPELATARPMPTPWILPRCFVPNMFAYLLLIIVVQTKQQQLLVVVVLVFIYCCCLFVCCWGNNKG